MSTYDSLLADASRLPVSDRLQLIAAICDTVPEESLPQQFLKTHPAVDYPGSGNDADHAWSEEKNSRRCDLIDKEIEGTLSEQERIELDDLQRQAVEYRDRVAPLPMEGAGRLHAQLLEKKRQKSPEK